MDDRVILLVAAVPLFVLWAWAIVDAIRRPDLSPARRVAWVVTLVFVPIIVLALYVVVRPPRARRIGRGNGAGASRATALVEATEANRHGDLSDDDYRTTVAELTPRPS